MSPIFLTRTEKVKLYQFLLLKNYFRDFLGVGGLYIVRFLSASSFDPFIFCVFELFLQCGT